MEGKPLISNQNKNGSNTDFSINGRFGSLDAELEERGSRGARVVGFRPLPASRPGGYGSVPEIDVEEQQQQRLEIDEDFLNGGYKRRGRKARWSVLEKLDRRHYCQIRTCTDCARIFNCRCLLATCMLGSFLLLAVAFADVLFFASEIGPVRYDYIIVGGGPAGSLLTNKLASTDARVLLLEAGDATIYSLGGRDYMAGPVTRFDIPFFWPRTASSPSAQFHWSGTSSSRTLLAKGLGGCGVVGSMIYLRALPADIKAWAVSGWTWERMMGVYNDLESFLSSQTANSDSLKSPAARDDSYSESGARFHGYSGPLATSSVPTDALGKHFIASVKSAGGEITDDFNRPSGRDGAGHYHFNIDGSARDSAANKFLGPVANNNNLVIELGATARRIILQEVATTASTSATAAGGDAVVFNLSPFSSSSNNSAAPSYRAIGIEYEQGGMVKTAYLRTLLIASLGSVGESFKNPLAPALPGGAQRAIVLTAGAINTPKLLLNSGIGPRDVLQQAEIEAKVVLAGVGVGLQDHPGVAVTFQVTPATSVMYGTAMDVVMAMEGYAGAVDAHRQYCSALDEASQRASTASNGELSANITEPAPDKSMLATPGFSAGAFLRSPSVAAETESLGYDPGPDLQLIVYPSIMDPHVLAARAAAGLKDESGREGFREAMIKIALLRPDSRQQVVLDRLDPYNGAAGLRVPLESEDAAAEPSHPHTHTGPEQESEIPSIAGVGLLSSRDVARLAWGITQVRSILKSEAMKQYVVADGEIEPGVDVDEESLNVWVRAHALPSSNWAGSCRMGSVPLSDLREMYDSRDSSANAHASKHAASPLTVVDQDLRVLGVENLRIADASVLPRVTNGNIHATVLAVAAVAAEKLLGQEKETVGAQDE